MERGILIKIKDMNINEAIISVLLWLEKFGIAFVIGGFLGAVVQRTRKRMTWRKFISVAVMGMFVGWIIGSVLTEWTNFGEKVIYSACALSGVFAEDILKELEKLVGRISEFISTFINNKINK